MDRRKRYRQTVALMSMLSETKTVDNVDIATFDGNGENLLSLIVGIDFLQAGWTELNIYDDPVYGGFIEWNQLVNNGNFETVNDWLAYNATISVDGNVITATSPVGQGYFGFRQRYGASVISGHIYLLSIEGKASVENYSVYNPYYNASVFTERASGSNLRMIGTSWVSLTAIVRATSDGDALLGIRKGGSGDDDEERIIYGKNACIFDLTQMFGQLEAERIFTIESENEGAGVAYFRNLFPHYYYPYNVGENTCVSAVNGNPYKQYEIAFPSAAIPVYSGTLDVVKGKLTVTNPDTDPVVYDVEPVVIQTFAGENNIWADTGKIIFLEYEA